MKWCSGHQAHLPESRFTSAIVTLCRECRKAYDRARYRANRDAEIRRVRKWQKKHPKRVAKLMRQFLERHPGYKARKMREYRSK
jgi:hypothetical protein